MRLRIKNWKHYQHYKDRCPPWIKLHFKILHSKDWVSASDPDRVLAIASMLIASQDDANDGSFEADPDYFKRVAYLHSEPDFKALIRLGFLEATQADASGCKQMLADATTETETETETEEEEDKNAAPSARTLISAETELFRRGKEILGQSSGGVITKLVKSKSGDIALARAAIEIASTKQDPREYIGAIIRGRDSPEDLRARGEAW